MNFLEYRELALRTAVYPAAARVHYPVLKLAGEAGEAADKMLSSLPDEGPKSILAELGDILWYVAAITRDVDVTEGWMSEPLSGLAAKAHMNESEPAAGSELGLLKNMLRLLAAATFPAEKLGKLIRDHGAVSDADLGVWASLPPEVLAEATEWMTLTLGEVARELAVCANALGSGLVEVAARNIEKLASRQARGVLKGAGDNR